MDFRPWSHEQRGLWDLGSLSDAGLGSPDHQECFLVVLKGETLGLLGPAKI